MTPREEREARETIDRVHQAIRDKGRGCGDCNLCCDLMAVEMPPVSPEKKPERTPCCFMGLAGGCRIYDDKPDSCSTFMCLWLATQAFDNAMPEALRPDRTGVVMDMNGVGNVIAHCRDEDSWKQFPMNLALRELAAGTHVLLDLPSGKHRMLHYSGASEELVRIGLGPDGNWLYRTKLAGER